jgi:hypothetical protein
LWGIRTIRNKQIKIPVKRCLGFRKAVWRGMKILTQKIMLTGTSTSSIAAQRVKETIPESALLRNYAHHAQSPKSSVHSVHKMQGKAI